MRVRFLVRVAVSWKTTDGGATIGSRGACRQGNFLPKMPLDCRKLHFSGPRAVNFYRLVRVRFLVRVGVNWETTDLERDHCFARNVRAGGFFWPKYP